MALFLDSANIDDAHHAQEWGFIEGITTTPASIAQNGEPALETLTRLVEIFDGHVFYQVTAATLEARIDEAWQAYEVRPDRVVIAIPMAAENLMMVSKLSGVDIAVTGIYSPSQAYVAAMAKVLYVIPELKQAAQIGGDGIGLIRDCLQLLEGTETPVLVGGISTVEDAEAVLQAGARNLTLPLHLINELANRSRR